MEKIISFLFLVPSSMLSTVSVLGAQNIGANKLIAIVLVRVPGVYLTSQLFLSVLICVTAYAVISRKPMFRQQE